MVSICFIPKPSRLLITGVIGKTRRTKTKYCVGGQVQPKINEGSFGQGQAHGGGSAHLEATLLLGGLGGLVDEGLVDVGDDTTTGDGGLDKGVELLVTTDGELEMAGSDTLDLEVLAGVTGELEDLGGQILKDGGSVDGGGGTDTLGLLDGGLEETVDTTDGELSCFVWKIRR